MPNLNQIYSLKQRFYDLSASDIKVKDFIEKSKVNDTLKKAFNSERLGGSINETRIFSFLQESINVKPDLIKYFEDAKEEYVALIFVDITSFSKTIKGFSNDQIKRYLDDYYKNIIPLIYKHGGEIEKLMGDGIIIVFGKPFLNLASPDYVYKAEAFAEEVIKKFHKTDKNVKVAIHKGTINYYKVPGELYSEYTMIGQPITDLYRLESVSKGDSVNFYKGSTYDKLGWDNCLFDTNSINYNQYALNSLQGVDYTDMGAIKFSGYL